MADAIHGLRLFRKLIGTARKFEDANVSAFAVRRIRHAFKLNKTEQDPAAVQAQLADGVEQLSSLKRQVGLSVLYK